MADAIASAGTAPARTGGEEDGFVGVIVCGDGLPSTLVLAGAF